MPATGKSLSGFAPSAAGKPAAVANFAKFERLSASPSDVINLLRMNNEIDVRAILPTIRVPTLVIHRRDDVRVRSQAGRELPQPFPARAMSRYPGTITSPRVPTRTRSSRKFGSSWAPRQPLPKSIEYCRPCCSPT